MKKVFIILIIILLIILITIILIPEKNINKIPKTKIEKSNSETLQYINSEQLNEKLNNNESFLLYTYNNFCSLSKPCENIFIDVLNNNYFFAYKIPFEEFKKTVLYKNIKHGPSFIIIKDGIILDYLDSNSNEDKEKYQDNNTFEEWLLPYIES